MTDYSLEPANVSDYRDFLRERFNDLKKERKTLSLQACAQRSGLSKSHLQFLFKKERHITLDKFPGLAKALKLTSEEEYFTYLMICKNSSQNEYVKTHFENIMRRIRNQYVSIELEDPISTSNQSIEKELYEDILYMILQSMVRLEDFKEDSKWIIESLPLEDLTEEKVISGLRFLEKVGAIERNKNGKLVAKEYLVFRPDPYDPKGFNVYTKAAEYTADLMQNPYKYSPSVYSSMALAMDEENLSKAEKLMIETHHRLCHLAQDSKKPTATIYIANFLITMARLRKTEI